MNKVQSINGGSPEGETRKPNAGGTTASGQPSGGLDASALSPGQTATNSPEGRSRELDRAALTAIFGEDKMPGDTPPRMWPLETP